MAEKIQVLAGHQEIYNLVVSLSKETSHDPASRTRWRLVLADDDEELLADVSEFLSREFEIVGTARLRFLTL